MTSNSAPASQLLKQAYEALQRGDKQAARRWAQLAAQRSPDLEEPWLILAAVARPKVSIAYLERALAINPHSERARKGLEWARTQLRAQTTPELLIEKAASVQAEIEVMGVRSSCDMREMKSSLALSRSGRSFRASSSLSASKRSLICAAIV